MKLIDKVALVTGGARRMGRQIAMALAEEGCDIVIHYRNSRKEADELARDIRSLGRQAWCVCGDFANAYTAAITLRTAWDLAGWIDILVNNASEYSHSTYTDCSIEHMEELWRVNTLAPMMLTRTMQELAHNSRILPADYCGRIINILDRDVAKSGSRFMPYWLTKKSLEAFTTAAALELAPRFTVNAVAPGPVLAPERPELSEMAGELPLAVRPTPTDIAEAVLYLARAVATTGQILYVDSGQSLNS